MSKIIIRESLDTDLETIYNISFNTIKNSWNLDSFKEDFKNVFSKYYSLMYEDNLIGFMSLWVILDEVTITNICIKKEYQRMGLSNHLMNFLINEFKNFSLFLEVRQSNKIAINLYKKYGFKEISLRERYYKNPSENAIIMKKF